MSQHNLFTNIISRTQTGVSTQKKMKQEVKPSVKRPASSPAKGSFHKRSAFGDITNAAMKKQTNEDNKKAEKSTRRKSKRLEAGKNKTALNKTVTPVNDNDFEMSSDAPSSGNSSFSSAISDEVKLMKLNVTASPEDVATPTCFYKHEASPARKQLNYNDLDAANCDNIHECPEYAFVIFEYMRSRESQFVIEPDYMSKQKELTPDMRAIVVDWMVEIQESFELNHETLYLAVKLLDLYLQSVKVARDKLQLVGATALLIAAKFDERHPPFVDDFLYICDDSYSRTEIIHMEMAMLKQIGFDINIPIAYRFLRRYAKCSKSNMKTLTLARFILELSLENFRVVHRSASLLAAASLWLAFKMDKSSHKWDDTLQYFSSHTENDIFELACELNQMITESKGKNLKTVWTKYSHSIFYEVAKTATLSDAAIAAERQRIAGGAREHKEFVQL